jgi:Flp pilus assembly protein TadD
MNRIAGLSLRQWLLFGAFQIIFGVVVFSATRAYYAKPAPATPTALARQAPAVTPAVLPDNPARLAEEADRLFTARDFVGAEAAYRKLLELAPGNVDAYNDLGLVLHYTGRSAAAVEMLEQGIARDVGQPRIWLTLGFVQVQRGQNAAAEEALRKVLVLQPEGRLADEARRFLDGLQ